MLKRILTNYDHLKAAQDLLLLEHSPAEAGRMLGISRSTVHDKILRLRRRFVEAGFVPNGGRG